MRPEPVEGLLELVHQGLVLSDRRLNVSTEPVGRHQGDQVARDGSKILGEPVTRRSGGCPDDPDRHVVDELDREGERTSLGTDRGELGDARGRSRRGMVRVAWIRATDPDRTAGLS